MTSFKTQGAAWASLRDRVKVTSPTCNPTLYRHLKFLDWLLTHNFDPIEFSLVRERLRASKDSFPFSIGLHEILELIPIEFNCRGVWTPPPIEVLGPHLGLFSLASVMRLGRGQRYDITYPSREFYADCINN